MEEDWYADEGEINDELWLCPVCEQKLLISLADAKIMKKKKMLTREEKVKRKVVRQYLRKPLQLRTSSDIELINHLFPLNERQAVVTAPCGHCFHQFCFTEYCLKFKLIRKNGAAECPRCREPLTVVSAMPLDLRPIDCGWTKRLPRRTSIYWISYKNAYKRRRGLAMSVMKDSVWLYQRYMIQLHGYRKFKAFMVANLKQLLKEDQQENRRLILKKQAKLKKKIKPYRESNIKSAAIFLLRLESDIRIPKKLIVHLQRIRNCPVNLQKFQSFVTALYLKLAKNSAQLLEIKEFKDHVVELLAKGFGIKLSLPQPTRIKRNQGDEVLAYEIQRDNFDAISETDHFALRGLLNAMDSINKKPPSPRTIALALQEKLLKGVHEPKWSATFSSSCTSLGEETLGSRLATWKPSRIYDQSHGDARDCRAFSELKETMEGLQNVKSKTIKNPMSPSIDKELVEILEESFRMIEELKVCEVTQGSSIEVLPLPSANEKEDSLFFMYKPGVSAIPPQVTKNDDGCEEEVIDVRKKLEEDVSLVKFEDENKMKAPEEPATTGDEKTKEQPEFYRMSSDFSIGSEWNFENATANSEFELIPEHAKFFISPTRPPSVSDRHFSPANFPPLKTKSSLFYLYQPEPTSLALSSNPPTPFAESWQNNQRKNIKRMLSPNSALVRVEDILKSHPCRISVVTPSYWIQKIHPPPPMTQESEYFDIAALLSAIPAPDECITITNPHYILGNLGEILKQGLMKSFIGR